MHQRYGFELIENEPDYKVYITKPNVELDGEECFVEIVHDYEDLQMNLISQLKMDKYIYGGFWKRLVCKLKMCYSILKGEELTFNGIFQFRGRNHIEDFAEMMTLLAKEVKQETNELIETKKELRKYTR